MAFSMKNITDQHIQITFNYVNILMQTYTFNLLVHTHFEFHVLSIHQVILSLLILSTSS